MIKFKKNTFLLKHPVVYLFIYCRDVTTGINILPERLVCTTLMIFAYFISKAFICVVLGIIVFGYLITSGYAPRNL